MIIAIIGLFCVVIGGFLTAGRRPVRWYDAILIFPLLSVIGVILYGAFVAPPGTCGSQDPGHCFSLTLLVGFLIGPLGLITTPILIFLLARRPKRP
ncbi:MAG: hypothetical protein AAFR20_10995 [Pseudomonadota bacterium]